MISYHKSNATLTRSTLRTLLRRTQWNEDDAIYLKLLKK